MTPLLLGLTFYVKKCLSNYFQVKIQSYIDIKYQLQICLMDYVTKVMKDYVIYKKYMNYLIYNKT